MSKKTKQQLIEKKGYNPYFIEEIQPKGGISFRNERYINAGDGYVACVHIYEYPKFLSPHWLSKVLNLDNVIAAVDIHTENTVEVMKNINKSMREQDSRFKSAKNPTEAKDAARRYQELDALYDELSAMGEIVKLIAIRLFVSAKTLDELDKLCKGTMDYLEANGYRSAIFLNESKNEWRSLFSPYTAQSKNEYGRDGQPILSETLAGGHPFHFICLGDPLGTYYGTTTQSGGSVLLDLFAKTAARKSYNALVVGKSGAGKSTLLKKTILDRAIRGDFIRVIDPTGEFHTLIEYLGGAVISLDGSDGILNALEILKTSNDKAISVQDNENISFARHMSKMKTIYKFLAPGCDQYDTILFEQLLYELYERMELVPISGILRQLTGLPPDRYPIFSDLLDFIDRKIKTVNDHQNAVEKDLHLQTMRRLNNVRLVIGNLISSYGGMFNGHSSLANVMGEQIVSFSIKNLAGMKSEIFDAQIFSALSLCWDNCAQLGGEMKNRFDDNTILWEDITRFLIIIDEAHKIINTNKLTAVEQLTVFGREARKYFGGLLFASQNIRDYVPEGSRQEAIQQIKILFELTQYKFVMQQDTGALKVLREVFDHQLTETELSQVPKFKEGQCILAIDGDRTIEFKIEITDEEKDHLFKGGA